ncbi:MAG: hypothetical protein COA79_17690 [Planctomycetota bacterium]|nr:MAG: hypothetical protein COA79_17690 [Planctomycetota bacterium]
MNLIIVKYLFSAGIIVLASELAKKSDKFGALVASLPLMTFLVMFWLYVEKEPPGKIAQHAYYTFWYVIPTLPMFLLFPYLIKQYGFWVAVSGSVLLTVACFASLSLILKKFDINLI